MDVWIGTSGYSYPDWVGPFYPAPLRRDRMLTYYSRQFPFVELNFTFYRVPTAAMLARMADQTSAGFQFVVKVPHTASHDRSRADLPGFRLAVTELQERGKLLGVLAQLPQSAHDRPADRAWIETLAEELRGLNPAVEFRHYSWSAEDVAPWLKEHGVDLVSVDVPNLPGLFPTGLVQSGSHLYVRLHSRNAANWYASEKKRYDYDYNSEELGDWVSALAQADADRALVLFNNCHHGHATANARTMTELCGRNSRLQVVESIAATEPVQRSLFD